MEEFNENQIIGKTIKDFNFKGVHKCDDIPYLELFFDDNTSVLIHSWYGGYTGKSEDEYPCFISISENYLKDKED